MMRVAWVAVPVPTLDLLTYRIPDDSVLPVPGARVRVSVGSRHLIGCVIRVDDTYDASADTLKDIDEILDDHAFLPPPVVSLVLWMAEYYACGPGQAVAAAMPPQTPHKTVRIAALSAQGHETVAALGVRQREALDALAGSPEGVPLPALAERGVSADTIKRLVERGLVVVRRERIERDPFGDGTAAVDLATANGDNPNLTASEGIVAVNPRGQTSNVSAPDGDADGFNVCWGADRTLTPCPPPAS